MNIGQTVADALIELARKHNRIELCAKDYANLRYGGPKAIGAEFEVVAFGDPRWQDKQAAAIGSCGIFIRQDVPELHARVGDTLVRLPYPEGFEFEG